MIGLELIFCINLSNLTNINLYPSLFQFFHIYHLVIKFLNDSLQKSVCAKKNRMPLENFRYIVFELKRLSESMT